MRFRAASLSGLLPQEVLEANYYVYNLSNNRKGENFELLSVMEDWCSLTGNWNNQYKTGKQIAELTQDGNELKFDITTEMREWCEDITRQGEQFGIQLKTVDEKEGEWNLLLSNDNTLYRNRTEILFRFVYPELD